MAVKRDLRNSAAAALGIPVEEILPDLIVRPESAERFHLTPRRVPEVQPAKRAKRSEDAPLSDPDVAMGAAQRMAAGESSSSSGSSSSASDSDVSSAARLSSVARLGRHLDAVLRSSRYRGRTQNCGKKSGSVSEHFSGVVHDIPEQRGNTLRQVHG